MLGIHDGSVRYLKRAHKGHAEQGGAQEKESRASSHGMKADVQ